MKTRTLSTLILRFSLTGALPALSFLVSGPVLNAQNYYNSNGSALRDPNKPYAANPAYPYQLLFDAVLWTGSTGDLLSAEAWSSGTVPNDPEGARTFGSTYSGTLPAGFVPGTVLVLPYKATDGTYVIPNTQVTEDPVSVFKPYGGAGGAHPTALWMAYDGAGARTLKVDQIQYTDNYALAIQGNEQGRFTLELAGQGFVKWHIPLAASNTGILGLTNLRPIQVSVGEYATLKYTGTHTATDVWTNLQNWDNRNTWLSLQHETSVLEVDSTLGASVIVFSKIDGVAGSEIKIRGGTTLTIDAANATSRIDSVISQTGTAAASLAKAGTGELYLGGINTYTGATALSAGALFINGSVLGNVAASVNSFLGGDALASDVDWNIGGNVTAGGAVYVSAGASGQRTGELRIKGDFTQNGQLTWLIVELAGDGEGGVLHDKIVVGGAATLTGCLSIRPVPGLTLYAGRYLVMDAGSLTGSFFNVVMPGFLSIVGSVNYDYPNGDVYIDFAQRRFSEIAGLAGNSLSAAAVVDNIVERWENSATDKEKLLVGTLNAVTGLATMDHALAQLTPLADRYWFPTAVAMAGDIGKRLSERVPFPLAEGGGRFAVFAGVSMLNSDMPTEGMAESISIRTSRFLGGVDFYAKPNLTLSAFYSNEITKADTDNYGGKGKIKGDSFGAHADWRAGSWRFQGTAHVGTDDYESNRSIMLTGMGDYTDSRASGDRLGAALHVSRAFSGVAGGTLLPYAGLQWLSWTADAYAEGNASLPMRVEEQSADSLIASMGLRFEYSYTIKKYNMQARTFASAGWQRELGGTDRTISATLDRTNYAVAVHGKKNGFDLRAGLALDVRRFTLSFSAGRENGVHGYDNVSYYAGVSRQF
jgi:autotransporter-associated beta strand protein